MSPDMTYSKKLLNVAQPPYYDSHLNLGIFMKEPDGREGNLIGEGGVCQPENCWPQLNYNLDKNYWNKVYATEFVTAFMRFWWSLPRETARFQVQPSSLYTLSTSDGIEMVCA